MVIFPNSPCYFILLQNYHLCFKLYIMEQTKKYVESVFCQDCNDPIELKREIEVGEIIECPTCGAEMEVVSLEPVVVSLIEEEK